MKARNHRALRKGKLILKALLDNGALSEHTLRVLVPEIKHKRNFMRILTKLVQKQLVVKRQDHILRKVAIFYQLNQSDKFVARLAKLLNCKESSVRQREYFHRSLFHEQTAVLIKHYLKKNYPNALVLRDFELVRHDEAKDIIPYLDEVDSPKPDVFLIFPKVHDYKSVSIAIEFDRTAKAKHRLAEKLRYYTSKTRVDGVIYICSEDRITNNLTEIYDAKIIHRAMRINNYGKNFLLTTPIQNDFDLMFSNLKNQCGKYYSLDSWIHYLLFKPSVDRKDLDFAKGHSECAL